MLIEGLMLTATLLACAGACTGLFTTPNVPSFSPGLDPSEIESCCRAPEWPAHSVGLSCAGVRNEVGQEDQEGESGPLDDEGVAKACKGFIGEQVTVVRSKHFRVIGVCCRDQGRDLTDLSERVYRELTSLLGISESKRIWEGTVDLFLVRDRKQYATVIEKMLPRYGVPEDIRHVHSRFLKVASSGSPPVAVIQTAIGSELRSWVVAVVARAILGNGPAPKRFPIWFVWGLSWDWEERLVGVIATHRRFTMKNDDGLATSWRHPGNWRNLLLRLAQEGKLMRARVILNSSSYVNDWSLEHRAHLWAFSRFLARAHPDELRKWVKGMQSQGVKQAFEKAFAWSDAQFETEWLSWIKSEFSGAYAE